MPDLFGAESCFRRGPCEGKGPKRSDPPPYVHRATCTNNSYHSDTFDGKLRHFRDYYARGAGITDYAFDDGTIAPTAAVSSVAFAPEIAIPAAEEMHRRHGPQIYGRYGFLDSFNPSFVAAGVKLSDGQVLPGFGWVSTDYLGIDQGEIIAMIANYRDDAVWKVTRKNPHLRQGLARAGFTGGWLGRP